MKFGRKIGCSGINIAALLKGGIKLNAMYDSTGVLRKNEIGGIEAEAKPCTERK